jgi:hypothetical protein
MRPLDVLELELRRLSNVSYVGFMDRQDALVVQLLALGAPDPGSLHSAAERICHAHLDRPFIVEIAGATRPTRIKIIDVRTSAGEDDQQNHDNGNGHSDAEIEVHLAYEGVRTIGRAKAGDPSAAAAATFEALKRMGARVPFRVEAAALFEHTMGEGVMLVLGSSTAGERYGVAAGETVEMAAVRATLHALNRYLSTQTLPALAS